jgi:hypothetical protein
MILAPYVWHYFPSGNANYSDQGKMKTTQTGPCIIVHRELRNI